MLYFPSHLLSFFETSAPSDMYKNPGMFRPKLTMSSLPLSLHQDFKDFDNFQAILDAFYYGPDSSNFTYPSPPLSPPPSQHAMAELQSIVDQQHTQLDAQPYASLRERPGDTYESQPVSSSSSSSLPESLDSTTSLHSGHKRAGSAAPSRGEGRSAYYPYNQWHGTSTHHSGPTISIQQHEQVIHLIQLEHFNARRRLEESNANLLRGLQDSFNYLQLLSSGLHLHAADTLRFLTDIQHLCSSSVEPQEDQALSWPLLQVQEEGPLCQELPTSSHSQIQELQEDH